MESGTGAVCRVHVGSEAIGTHPLTALEFGLVAEPAGLHAGVLNIVTGFGPEAGQPLTEHPDVDKLAITGSVPAGIRIMATEAKDIKTISFELDGKSPMVVFADTPIEEAVEWIMFGIFWNQGEVCLATSRVLIEEEIYEPLLARLNEESEKIRIGHGLADGVLLVPLVSQSQHEKVFSAFERGKTEGATVLSGGGVPEGLEHGCNVQPTSLADAPLDGWVWNEEIFGPVMCFRPFKTEEESIALAHTFRFDFGSAVRLVDVGRANWVARAFRAGIVLVDYSQPTFSEAPLAGIYNLESTESRGNGG